MTKINPGEKTYRAVLKQMRGFRPPKTKRSPLTYAAAVSMFAQYEDCSPVEAVAAHSRCRQIARQFGKTPQQVAADINRVYLDSTGDSMAKKFGLHTTVHSPALKRALDAIIGLPPVDRIIIGVSKGTRHNRPVGTIKLQANAPNGVKMVGYGDRGITSFFIVTSNPEAVRQDIAKKFGL